MKTLLLTLFAAALLCTTACTPHTTEATEVGVRFNKITGGTEVAQPGATAATTAAPDIRVKSRRSMRIALTPSGCRGG